MNDNTISEVEIERLRQARELAQRGYSELTKARSTEADAAKQLALQKIRADLDRKYGERTEAAKEALDKADREFQDALVRYSRGRLQSEYESIEVVKWESSSRFRETAPLSPTLRGQLQVCDRDAKFPANAHSTKPQLGEIFIRLYNKTTGEIGLRFVRIERYGLRNQLLPSSWRYKGVNPNVKKESA